MLETLVTRLFDYAGMFPPAALSMEDALSEITACKTELTRPAMIGNDFVVAAKDLDRFNDEMVDAAGFQGVLETCVVGVGADNFATVLERVASQNGRGGKILFTAIEVVAEPEKFDWAEARAKCEDAFVRLYMEPPWNDEKWQNGLDGLWPVLEKLRETGPAVGLKFRGAGPNQVSHATICKIIKGVVERGLPLKATQGLHHPILEAEIGNDHGFLNLLVALRMHGALGLSDEEIMQILGCSDAADFTFVGLGWNHRVALAQQVQSAAARVPFAIGSCSLREPDEDLLRLLG